MVVLALIVVLGKVASLAPSSSQVPARLPGRAGLSCGGVDGGAASAAAAPAIAPTAARSRNRRKLGTFDMSVSSLGRGVDTAHGPVAAVSRR